MGWKVAVIARVLIDGEQAIRLLRKLHEQFGFFQSCREWFVDNHVAPRLKALPRGGTVRLVGSRDHNEANLLNREQFVKAAHDSNVRIFFRGFGAAALHYGGEMQTRHSTNYWRVKGAASETESNQPNFNHE